MKNIQRKKISISLLKIFTFFVCLVIAFLLWFTHEMEKTYNYKTEILVHYTNTPDTIILNEEIPKSFFVWTEGTGWGLLRHNIYDESEIVIDVDRFLKSGKPTINIEDNILDTLLGSQLKIVNVSPTIISIDYELVYKKKVPIVSNISLSYFDDYIQDTLIQSVDSVVIYGKKSIIDTISYVKTMPFSQSNIDESFTQEIDFEDIEDVLIEPTNMSITCNVDEIIKQTINVPIKQINISNTLFSYKLSKDTIDVDFYIRSKKTSLCKVQDFNLYVDYNDSIVNSSLPIHVEYPSYVERMLPLSTQYVVVNRSFF